MRFVTTTRLRFSLDMLLSLAFISVTLQGQAQRPEHSSEVRPIGGVEPSGIIREIDDPSFGDRWFLVRSDGYPGGPDRLVLASRDGTPELPAVHHPPAGALVPVI